MSKAQDNYFGVGVCEDRELPAVPLASGLAGRASDVIFPSSFGEPAGPSIVPAAQAARQQPEVIKKFGANMPKGVSIKSIIEKGF